MRVVLRLALEKETVFCAARLALVVGPMLVVINHGDVIPNGHQIDWLKVLLTFAVPYCVSTGTSVSKDIRIAFNKHSINTRKF